MEKRSQKSAILSFLKRGGIITPVIALQMCGCFRLSARIYDLRREGYNIVTTQSRPFAKYYLP